VLCPQLIERGPKTGKIILALLTLMALLALLTLLALLKLRKVIY
jgi:hypothetical protein